MGVIVGQTIEIVQLVANMATIFAVFLALYALKENIMTRKTSIKPLLLPGRIKDFVSDDNLFACNYEYPIAEDIGTPALVYFGIRNIGKGPAKNVKVLSFESEEETPIIFRVGSNFLHIPEGASIPFVIRITRGDPTDYFFVTYSTTIYYEDLFGGHFYLSIRIWIEENSVTVIEYSELKEPKWSKLMTAVSREVELTGYFEMRKLESQIKKNDD